MSQIRVLGIGSPFGDDQLGWEVVKLLQKDARLSELVPHHLLMNCYDRPGVRILEFMHDAKTVFLIDAIKTGSAIGTRHRFENKEITQLPITLSSHTIGIVEAIQLGDALQELPEQIILYGIEIGEVDRQFHLTKSIQEAIVKLAEEVKNEILTCSTSGRNSTNVLSFDRTNY